MLLVFVSLIITTVGRPMILLYDVVLVVKFMFWPNVVRTNCDESYFAVSRG